MGTPPQGRPRVVELGLDALQHLAERGVPRTDCDLGGTLSDPAEVTVTYLGKLACGVQLLEPELADRLQHPEARLAVGLAGLPHEAALDQLRHHIEHIQRINRRVVRTR